MDLLAVTHLIPKKKVGLIRDLSQNGPIAQVLVDQRLASTEAIAKIVAARHQLPRVELGSAGVDSEASATVPNASPATALRK